MRKCHDTRPTSLRSAYPRRRPLTPEPLITCGDSWPPRTARPVRNGSLPFGYCCSPDLQDGVNGNITADPQFTDIGAGDFTLFKKSPCKNAGVNAAWMESATDLAGNKRRLYSVVDIGAYEIVPPAGSMIMLR